MEMKDFPLKWIAPIHRKFREDKCKIFFSTLDPSPYDSLLDVGGNTGILGEFERLYRFFHSVQVVNLVAQSFKDVSLRNVRFDMGMAAPCPISTSLSIGFFRMQ